MSRRSTNPAIVFAMLIWIAAGSSIIVADEGRDANRENDHVYFERDVLPAITAAGCNTGHCHGSSVPRENGGFRLSLFESDPQQDYAALVDGPTGPLVDTKSPGKSQLLRKAKGELKHASGQKWPQDSRSIKTIQRWISLGANHPAKGDPRITRILVEPSTVDVRKGDTFRLRVRAVDSSGVQRDVTQMMQFRIVGAEDGEPVARAADAAFKVQSPGNAVIVVKYARRTAMVAVRAPFSDPVEVLNFEPNNFVDGLLARRWRQMGVNPVANADDWQFARRTWVHLTGRNPHADEVQMFVASSLPDKRGQWIERALAHPDYAKHWAETWQDWLDTEESNLSNDERAEFDDWLRSVFRESLSAREMAASLLTAVGTINTDPASGYMLSSKNPAETAEAVSRFFLGVESRCFRCHDHPLGDWRPTHYHGLVATFAGIARRTERGVRTLVPRAPVHRDPGTRRPLAPSVLGQQLALQPGQDPRRVFIRWLLSRENLQFARSLINHYWEWLMTEPLLPDPHEPQPGRLSPNSDLLDALARDLIAHDYDLKHLIRRICGSRAYQFAIAPRVEHDLLAHSLHYRRLPQRIPPRMLLRMLEQITEVSAAECGVKAGAFGNPFNPFPFPGGRPKVGKCDLAKNQSYLSSALHLVNGNGLSKMLQHRKGRAARLAASDLSDEQVTEELYLVTLCRSPTPEETKVVCQHLGKVQQERKVRRYAVEDVLWALINSTEFLSRLDLFVTTAVSHFTLT